jgi:hypothetical protein
MYCGDGVGNGLEGGVDGGSERNGRREGKLSTRESLSPCGTHRNISRGQQVSKVSEIFKFAPYARKIFKRSLGNK